MKPLLLISLWLLFSLAGRAYTDADSLPGDKDSLQNAAFYYLMTDSLDRAEASIREVEQIHDANGFSDLSDLYLVN